MRRSWFFAEVDREPRMIRCGEVLGQDVAELGITIQSYCGAQKKTSARFVSIKQEADMEKGVGEGSDAAARCMISEAERLGDERLWRENGNAVGLVIKCEDTIVDPFGTESGLRNAG